jgi:predicted nucleotidyltransferase
VESLPQRVVDVFASRSDVSAVYLFGSTARGDAQTGSDVDVAVLFESPQPGTIDAPRFAIEGELERVVGKPVDLVALNDAPVDLRIRVLRHGRLLLDRVPKARIAFEVRTRNEAFDIEPVLARYRSPRSRER